MDAPRPRKAVSKSQARDDYVASGDAWRDASAALREAIKEGRHPQSEFCAACACFAHAIYPSPVICPECGKTLAKH